jgi:putative ABC transport system substrate-binding protein
MSGVQRRGFLIASGALLAAPRAALAQQAARPARIGYLALDTAGGLHLKEAFPNALRDLGYAEGRDVVIEFRDAEGKVDRFPALAAELVALKVDLIFAPSTLAALAAMRATSTIPIVFAGAADPVADGLVARLPRPGGNVTGLSNLSSELVGKRLELINKVVPGSGRVAVLWQTVGTGGRAEKDMLKATEVTASALGMGLQFFEARTPAEIERAFPEMIRARVGALMVLPIGMFFSERRRLVSLAATNRLPAIYPSREFVEIGGLMSYGANLIDLLRRAAAYADRILKGAKPGDLPVEQPTKFELLINLKTARNLALAIPPEVAARADQVIQ